MHSQTEQTKSKTRAQAHGEVFTAQAQVKAMLRLVRGQIHRPESRFLDPACGTGNFLVEIFRQKAAQAKRAHADDAAGLDTALQAVLQGIYGVDILQDNVAECQARLLQQYLRSCAQAGVKSPQKSTAQTILQSTITCADALKCPPKMRVDVVVGNPPFHSLDGTSASRSACPIYHKFVQMAKAMQPQCIVMLIPARWFAGGRGLAAFRAEMLADRQIRVLCDIPNAAECFPRQAIKGGVCYFLWQKGSSGDCKVLTQRAGKVVSRATRPLQQPGLDVLVRSNELLSILKKVQKQNEASFATLLSPNDPFGFDVRQSAGHTRIAPHLAAAPQPDDVAVYYHGWRKAGLGYLPHTALRKGQYRADWVKLLLPKAWGSGNAATDWLQPIAAQAGTCCTETYLVAGPFANEAEAQNAISYLQTRFFHAMVSLRKGTQNAMRGVYAYVPMQDFSHAWNDAMLYQKYKLTSKEIAFLQANVCPSLPQRNG